jgi:hypothetical protein
MLTRTLVFSCRTWNVQGPSPDEERKLLYTKIVIGPARFEWVGIHQAAITAITLRPTTHSPLCFDAFKLPGTQLYVKGRNELLVDFEGSFFKAVRPTPVRR